MEISSGISEINLNTVDTRQKIYIWPNYTDEPVDPVRKITRNNYEEKYYIKPSKTEKEKILNTFFSKNSETYSANACIKKNNSSLVFPGSFFDALV